jgi:hypothetical protein
VFDELSMQRKQIFRFTEFENNYNKAFSKSSGYVSFDVVCKVLFHYSAIGNQPSQHSARIFKYLQPQARINYKEKAIIHAGLLQSLQIS